MTQDGLAWLLIERLRWVVDAANTDDKQRALASAVSRISIEAHNEALELVEHDLIEVGLRGRKLSVAEALAMVRSLKRY